MSPSIGTKLALADCALALSQMTSLSFKQNLNQAAATNRDTIPVNAFIGGLLSCQGIDEVGILYYGTKDRLRTTKNGQGTVLVHPGPSERGSWLYRLADGANSFTSTVGITMRFTSNEKNLFGKLLHRLQCY